MDQILPDDDDDGHPEDQPNENIEEKNKLKNSYLIFKIRTFAKNQFQLPDETLGFHPLFQPLFHPPWLGAITLITLTGATE